MTDTLEGGGIVTPPTIIPDTHRVLVLTTAQLITLHTLAQAGAYYLSRLHGQSTPSAATLLTTLATATQQQRHPRHPHTTTPVKSWPTARTIANATGYSLRTVQRRAKAWGAVKHHGVWKYPPHLIEQGEHHDAQ